MNPIQHQQAISARRILREVSQIIYLGRAIRSNPVANDKRLKELAVISFTVHDVEFAEHASGNNQHDKNSDLLVVHKLLCLLKALCQIKDSSISAKIADIELKLIQATACVLLDPEELSKVDISKVSNVSRQRLESDFHLLCWCIAECTAYVKGEISENVLVAKLINLRNACLSFEAATQNADSASVKTALTSVAQSIQDLHPSGNHADVDEALKGHCPTYSPADIVEVESTLAIIVRMVLDRQKSLNLKKSTNLHQIGVNHVDNLFQSATAGNTTTRDRNLTRQRKQVNHKELERQDYTFALQGLKENYAKEKAASKNFDFAELVKYEDIVIGLAAVRLAESSYVFFRGSLNHNGPISKGLSVSREALGLSRLYHDFSTLAYALHLCKSINKRAAFQESKTHDTILEFVDSCMHSLYYEREINAKAVADFEVLEKIIGADVVAMHDSGKAEAASSESPTGRKFMKPSTWKRSKGDKIDK